MTRLHEGLVRELLDEVAIGEVSPGEMLPREVDLVERFHVSRGVIRECLRALEERDVVAVKHGRGATVVPSEQWNVLDPDVLRAMLAAPGGEDLLGEALDCQRLLEVEAAALAAEHADGADIEALNGALELLAAEAKDAPRTAAAAQRYREAELEFHRLVVRASGNRALARLSAPLHRALLAAATERGGTVNAKRRLTEYRAIVAAIVDRDAETARSAMSAHLAAAARALRRPKRSA